MTRINNFSNIHTASAVSNEIINSEYKKNLTYNRQLTLYNGQVSYIAGNDDNYILNITTAKRDSNLFSDS